MKSEIKERDNRNLVQAGKEIKRTIIKLPSIFWGKRKALEAPKEENPQPQMEKRSFETERAKFLQEVQGSEPMKKTHKNQDNTTERRMVDKGKEANAPKTDDGRFE